ncbi:hypothetical protein [Thiolapillus brandeum]|uniref:hypothetical protein n=1 Tax=Thiolapillus brandeum TaxID=1076588 RepID=UPI00059776DA|nr:hypothetical protein [Thiolapillus brandeum]
MLFDIPENIPSPGPWEQLGYAQQIKPVRQWKCKDVSHTSYERRSARKSQGLTSDQTIELTSAKAANSAIVKIYKSRWQIELGFKVDQAEPEDKGLPRQS